MISFSFAQGNFSLIASLGEFKEHTAEVSFSEDEQENSSEAILDGDSSFEVDGMPSSDVSIVVKTEMDAGSLVPGTSYYVDIAPINSAGVGPFVDASPPVEIPKCIRPSRRTIVCRQSPPFPGCHFFACS